MLKLRSRLHDQIRRLSVDTRGVAAVEFVMLVPLMLMICFGTIQVSTAVAVDRKVSQTARTLSDLISQAPVTGITNTDISNAFGTSKAILSPYSSTPLQAIITQVYIDPTTLTAKVKWSKASNATAHACNTVVTVPSALLVSGTYLIMSEVTYAYTPIVGYDITTKFTSATFTMSDQMYARPRNAPSVDYPTANCP